MNLYKLTDANRQTRDNTQWGEGITNRAKSGGGELCSEHYIHAYTHPLLAIFFNPIHAQLENPCLWEARGRIAKRDHGLKVGCKSLTTIHELPCPTIALEQHMRFGLLGALRVCADSRFATWAKKWLNNTGRATLADPWSIAKPFLGQYGTNMLWYATKAISMYNKERTFAARYNAAAAVACAAWIKDIDLAAIAEEAMKAE